MRSARPGRNAVICLLAIGLPAFGADPSDIVLKAMRDELEHSKALPALNLAKPYFISYSIEDGELFTAIASLGGLISSKDARFRVPRIEVRVGDYQFDNTNYDGEGHGSRRRGAGGHHDSLRFPVEDSYPVLRRYLWLATDQTYKDSVETLAAKRAALKNPAAYEGPGDFARAEPSRLIEDLPASKLDRDTWLARVRALSGIFAGFPQVESSNIELQAIREMRRLINSEDTEVRTGEEILFVRARARGQAPDGMRLHDAASLHSLNLGRSLNEPDLEREVRQVAENVQALSRAQTGETYNGPVLFEGVAAAQLFAQLLGKNLALARRPISDAGQPNMFAASELEGRQGARILPDWMDVADDPTQQELNGRRLFGSYWVDLEGVSAKRLIVVEKGILKNFLLTRQPVGSFKGSNGRARLPGQFGVPSAGISNMFVRAAQAVPVADLKKQLMEICRTRNQPYGLIVKKLDFPSSADIEELRHLAVVSASDGGGSHLFSPPILVYKVTADGKEELIRGLRFRDLNVRSLRDIRAAGNDTNVFDYLDNGIPLALLGAGNYAAETSVIAPSVLMDDLEARKLDEELPSLPVVPSPLMAGK